MYDIREAGIPDRAAMLMLFNACRAQTPGLPSAPLVADEFSAQLEGEETWVAVAGGIVAGFASIWTADRFIHHLYVAPHQLRQGMGSQLLAFVEDRYGRPLSLKCSVSNRDARQFYEKGGWLPVDTASGDDGPYILYTLP